MNLDPISTDPDKYVVVFENERVRVLEYTDSPGAATNPHAHPDSVMVTLSSFRRRLTLGEAQRDVDLPAGFVTWLPAQEHRGQNIGDTETRSIFIELKEPAPTSAGATMDGPPPLGPGVP
ncbi:cupin domain-containing protein [Pengzhenrongella sicca]|uniref:Cytoplasmic protein n=1 Tax=Pengzhenrongella sicca TaxID=2819238 RepID=A0A8A4ZEK2_9MICO|nr:cytoplasmic protein [Pengzhenrongella sicca]QTE29735.1 cytoplasmic protein [Pengzhenrongella sicca]